MIISESTFPACHGRRYGDGGKPEQGAHGIKIARVEFPQLCVEQIVGEERAVFGAVSGRNIRIKTAPPLGFLAGHNCPTDRLGIVEDSGLDGFVFSGSGHDA